MSHRVFISHCEADNALALDICHRIERRGVKCWIAPRDVVVGEDYARRIGDAIEQSGAFVVVLSRHTNGSIFVKREVEYACSSKIPIFPVRIEKVEIDRGLKLFISISHRIDAFGTGRGRALEHLAQAVVRKVRGKRVEPAVEDIRELARLIGPGAMEFIRQWKRMDAARAPLAWSWEAFLGGAFWPFYRGMIGLGGALVAVLVILVLLGGVLGQGADGTLIGLLVGWLLVALYVGLTGSVALRRHVRRMLVSGQRQSRLKRLGGITAATLVVAGALLASVTTWPAPVATPVAGEAELAAKRPGRAADGQEGTGSSERRRAFHDPRREEEAAVIQRLGDWLTGVRDGVAIEREQAEQRAAETAVQNAADSVSNVTGM